MKTNSLNRPFRSACARGLLSITVLTGFANTVLAQTIVFQENFNSVELLKPVDEDSSIEKAFSHQGPDGWRVDSSEVPGVNNPSIGVTEWEGWSFANKNFWTEVSGDPKRSQFKRAEGTLIVADTEQWNDLGDPANNVDFYNTFLETPRFNIQSLQQFGDRLQFQFDSSWLPDCCDDGGQFAPKQNNKTATIRARFDDGSTVNLLRWESAPFRDASGLPSDNPNDTPNPFYKDIDLDELLFIDLTDLVLHSSHTKFFLEFGLTNAGDDFWWAMDNMQMISLETTLGDMDLNGVLEEDDIDDFAQAMHSSKDYILTHFGETPAIRGSVDSTFDFDDIDWFVGLLNDNGIAASQATILNAINALAVPEPSTACLATILFAVGIIRRKRQHKLTEAKY